MVFSFCKNLVQGFEAMNKKDTLFTSTSSQEKFSREAPLFRAHIEMNSQPEQSIVKTKNIRYVLFTLVASYSIRLTEGTHAVCWGIFL